jgi:two-component system sensor histidine kinase KdpD
VTRAQAELLQSKERHARELTALHTRLDQVEAFKLELTANVTHDLRTPLAGIKASVSGLLAGDVAYDPQQLRETLSVIEEETDRLQRRVTNLLSMARMESGAADLSEDWVDLSDVTASAVEVLKGLRGEREIRFTFADELPLVQGDYIQLQVAIRNLVENALLYSPPDQPIEVQVSANLGQVRVRVRDYGAGLMPDEFERVFDKFYRGRAARRIPGTGLGLPICRSIAEAHSGRLWAEHAPGGGVAFVLSLPASEPPLLPPGRAEAALDADIEGDSD